MTDKVHGALNRRPPSVLMTPFGWAAESLIMMTRADPLLSLALLEIDRSRLHLIGLALVHLELDALPELCSFLIQAPPSEVLDRVLCRRPPGLRRVFTLLPSSVMQPESYRKLIALLDDRGSAKLLHHAQTINESTIQMLHGTPPSLRRFALPLLNKPKLSVGLSDGLRFLASRGAIEDFDAFVAELASASDTAQFATSLGKFIDNLPLPDMPPMEIDQARRLDRVKDVCALAKRWKNCLADFAYEIDSGGCAVYIWKDTAACLIRRHERLGFFLQEAKGPDNAEIEPERFEQIRKVFADAQIPQASIIEGIEHIHLDARFGRFRRG